MRRRQLSKLDVVDVLDEASLGILASKVASGDSLWTERTSEVLISKRNCFVLLSYCLLRLLCAFLGLDFCFSHKMVVRLTQNLTW